MATRKPTTTPAPEAEAEKPTKYRVQYAMGAPDGKTYFPGDVVELLDKEAKHFNKHGAIGMYFEDDDEIVERELPKPKRKKPSAPKTLDDAALLTPDPKAV